MNLKSQNIPLFERHLFKILIILIGVWKVVLLLNFSWTWAGSDDLVLWMGANDYAKGIFHEPFFYGQNYNYMLESLFAVPLVWIGMSPAYAVPLVTLILGTFPFLFFAWVLKRRQLESIACLVLVLYLSFSIEFDMLTAMSRGFVTGLFACSFLIIPLLQPKKMSSFIILGACAGLGIILNPNSIVVIFPVAMYVLSKNIRNWKFYLLSFVGFLPFIVINYFSKQFYVSHPNHQVHGMWLLKFDFSSLLEGFTHLDQYFRYLMPIIWPGSWLVLIVLFVLGMAVFRLDKLKGTILFASLLLLLSLMGINKVNDDIGTIYLSSGRMYLGISLLLIISVIWMKERLPRFLVNKKVLLGSALVIVVVKICVVDWVVEKHSQQRSFGAVAVATFAETKSNCEQLDELLEEYPSDIVVFISNFENTVPQLEYYNYGCEILQEKHYSSVLNLYERRAWVYFKEKSAIHETVMLFNIDTTNIPDSLRNSYTLIQEQPSIIYIENNTKTLNQLGEKYEFLFQRTSAG